jgi:hypothetical protein
MNPMEVCKKALVIHDPKEGYTLDFMNKKVLCLPEAKRVCWKEDNTTGEGADSYLELVVVHYLLNAQELPLSKKMVTEKELPGGSFFFQGPHSLPTRLIEDRFSGKKEAFADAGYALGAAALEFGDISFQLQVLPRVSMGLIYWDRDEEFPPRCVITFDSTIDRHLPLDVIWAMTTLVARMLVQLHSG